MDGAVLILRRSRYSLFIRAREKPEHLRRFIARPASFSGNEVSFAP
jgi:hypothetical protein